MFLYYEIVATNSFFFLVLLPCIWDLLQLKQNQKNVVNAIICICNWIQINSSNWYLSWLRIPWCLYLICFPQTVLHTLIRMEINIIA